LKVANNDPVNPNFGMETRLVGYIEVYLSNSFYEKDFNSVNSIYLFHENELIN